MADDVERRLGEEGWVSAYRKRALACLIAAAFFEGLTFESPFLRAAPMRVLIAFTEASAVVAACMLDARLQNKLFLRSFTLPLFVTWPVGALVHLMWTRGWRRGVVVYLKCAALLVLVAATGMLAAWTLEKALG